MSIICGSMYVLLVTHHPAKVKSKLSAPLPMVHPDELLQNNPFPYN